jgi:hypothetical protein
MEGHYNGCQHSAPFVLNSLTQFLCVSQYTSEVIVVRYCMNSTISIPFLPSKNCCQQLSVRQMFV